MRANYNARRTSVVLNPRGRVLGGLGAEEGYGTGAESYSGNIYDGGDTQTSIDSQTAAAATFAAAQMANEAAMLAAANALAESRASNATSAKTAATIATGVMGFFGPIGMIAGLIGKATGFVDKAFENALNGQQLSYDKNISDANQALEGARGYAGDNAVINTEINKVQYNLDMVKKASIEAAVTQMYHTYAKRNPDPAALAYWSQRFGPTITADEVMEFQQALYANEPNLRPASYTQQQINEAIRISKLTFSDAEVITGLTQQGLTSSEAVAALNRFYASSTAQAASGGGLALPIIASVAGFFIFGG